MGAVTKIKKLKIGEDTFELTEKYPDVILTKNGEYIMSMDIRSWEEFVR